MKYIPAWIPGATFKKKAAVWRQEVDDMFDLPFIEAKRRIVRSIQNKYFRNSKLLQAAEGPDSSFVSFHLANKAEPESGYEYIIKATAGSMFAGGTDTVSSNIFSLH